MLWHALPPELNTAMLMAGAGPAPMLQAAAAWEALASALDTQAVEVGALLASLQGAWTGLSSERAVAAIAPMVTWLQDAAQASRRRGMQAAAQAASYTKALAMTPSLPDIARNQITRAVLSATNFLGINMVPIGLNETDYFVRMWNQAGAVMDIYQAETLANTVFEPLAPVKPILAVGAGEAAEVAAVTAAQRATPDNGGDPPTPAPTPAPASDAGTPDVEQVLQYLGGAAQLGAPVQMFAQQLMQPLQQLASMSSHAGSGAGIGEQLAGGLGQLGSDGPGHVGLVGAGALSNHPLAGGSGPSVGKGLMYAESLPGAGGSASRTTLMAALVDKPAPGVSSAAAGAGTSAMGGAATVGPVGAGGGHSGSATRPGLAAPAVLTRAADDEGPYQGFDDEDEW